MRLNYKIKKLEAFPHPKEFRIVRYWGTNKDMNIVDLRKIISQANTHWEPPGWIKLNFNRASKEKPSLTSGGVIHRSHKGELFVAYSRGLGIKTNNKFEASTALWGMKMALFRYTKHENLG